MNGCGAADRPVQPSAERTPGTTTRISTSNSAMPKKKNPEPPLATPTPVPTGEKLGGTDDGLTGAWGRSVEWRRAPRPPVQASGLVDALADADGEAVADALAVAVAICEPFAAGAAGPWEPFR